MKKLNNPTQEELFDLWCEDAIKAGYIDWVEKKVSSHTLTEGLRTAKTETRTLYKGTKREKEVKRKKYKTVLAESSYGPDRIIGWNPKAMLIFHTPIVDTIEFPWKETYFYSQYNNAFDCDISIIDVKAPPGYGGANCSDVSFSLIRKWIWYTEKIFINKVVNYPNSVIKDKKTKVFKKFKNPDPYLWMSTYTPSRYFKTDGLTKDRTISNWEARTIKEFENELLSKN